MDIRKYESTIDPDRLVFEHEKYDQYGTKDGEEDFYFQGETGLVYRNLGNMSHTMTRRSPSIVVYGGIVFEFGFLAI